MSKSGHEPYILTLIANNNRRNLDQSVIAKIADILPVGLAHWLAPDIACELSIAKQSDNAQSQLLARLEALLAPDQIDIAIQPQSARRKKLLIADMDSTIINQECIDELALSAGIYNEISQITAQAMNGEIDFDHALIKRVRLLKDLPLRLIKDTIKNRITLTKGAKTLVATMKAHGAHSALVSGGFEDFTSIISPAVGFDSHHANVLKKTPTHLTGEVVRPILGQEAKRAQLEALCQKYQIKAQQAICVGDGANDLAMLKAAGMGVAFHAKKIVADQAKIRLYYSDLTALLYIQGYHKSEFIIKDDES